MGLEVFDYVQNDVSEKGLDSDYGSTEVYFYNPNYANNMQFTHTNGWFKAGRLTGINDTPNFTNLDVMVGSPKMTKSSLITAYDHELVFTFDHPTLLGLKLARASNFIQKIFYSDTGQTTVKASSVNDVNFTNVTSPTGIEIGDFIECDNRNNTYGGFVEIARVTLKQTDKIYHTVISQPMIPGATFQKIAGRATGTGDSDIGIQTIIGAVKHPEVACKIVHNVTNNKSQEIKGFYKCINTTGTPKNFGDATALATITVTLKPVRYKATDLEDDDGNVFDAGIYGREFIIPPESV